MRIAVEDESISLYHCFDNTRIYHEKEPVAIKFMLQFGPVLEWILTTENGEFQVSKIPMDEIEEKEYLIMLLVKNNFAIIKRMN